MTARDSTTPLVSFRGVGVSYWRKKGMFRRERFFPLKDISFDLFRGDSLGIVGRNGAGKSTLLRLIAGVMTPDYGEVTGANTVTASLLTLQLGFVDYLSGRENAILGGMFLGMRKRDIEARLDQIVEFSELKDFIDQPLFAYSSGMRARLGFAVAFQLDPDILLVDEVTGVGDAEFREKSFRVIQDRLKSESSTVVFVSHAASQVRALCSKAIWIEDATLRMAGRASDVMDGYESFLSSRQPAQPLAGQGPEFFRKVGENKIYIKEQDAVRIVYSWDEFVDLGGRTDRVQVLNGPDFADLIQRYPVQLRATAGDPTPH